MSGVSITGPHAGEFRISSDQCTGRSFSGSASCNVSVQHVPNAPGTHLANLQVAKSGGGAESVPLQAFAFGGKTGFAYASDPGDFIGGGGSNAYTPSDVVIWPLWTLDHVRVFIYGVSGSNGNSFLAEFAAPKGEPFTPGTYLGATRWPFHEPGPGLSVTGFGHGCNKLTGHFTVGEIAYDAVGPIARFGATFEQHCEGAAPALRGELSFRAGDTTPLAPWMRIGPITSVPPRGAGTPAAAAHTPATGAAKRARLPSLTHLAVSPRAFRPSPRRRAASPPRHGTHLRFALDSPADVRFAVKRGWRRLVPVGKPFIRRFSAGPNSFRFTGRVGGRALKRGRYVVVATPTSDGRRGVAAKARFRVLGR